MGKIFVLIGKSASGKDAIYKYLLSEKKLGLMPYVGYTTRPKRDGEENGREYFFADNDELKEFELSGKLIEKRTYHTVHGDWTYFSVDNGKIDLKSNSYIYIGTLESYVPLRNYYGSDTVIPIYIEVENGERLSRALDRERKQLHPRYAEMCRRYLVDEDDFSEEKLLAAGISKRFENTDFECCTGEIVEYIKGELSTGTVCIVE